MQSCGEVVVISYSNPELSGCEADRRQKWLAQMFPKIVRLVIDPQQPDLLENLPERLRKIPTNDADAKLHRQFTGALCTHILGYGVDAVFTSEDYGNPFGEFIIDL